MDQQWRPHEAARVKSGRYAGLVGEVVDVRHAAVRVSVEGVRDGKPVRAVVWLKLSQVERNR